MTAVMSPCVNVCVIDPRTEFCIGCGRTRAEVAAWPDMDQSARIAVIGTLPDRLLTMTSRGARQGGRRARPPSG